MFKELLSRPDRSIFKYNKMICVEWLCLEQDQDDGEMVDNGRVALHSFRMKESHLRMSVYLLSSGLSSFTEGLKYLCLIWSTCLVVRFCLILVPSFELFLLVFTVYLENFYYKGISFYKCSSACIWIMAVLEFLLSVFPSFLSFGHDQV